MTDVKKFNSQTKGEEIANAISHGVGSVLSIAGTAVLIVLAALKSDAMSVVGMSIYGASLIILYTFSSLYHSFTNEKEKRVFQIFDHCSIFILILGSYTAICFTALRGTMGWVLFGINAFCTVLGITFNAIDLHRWHKISLVLYVLMGWSVVMGLKPLFDAVSLKGFMFLLIGGVLYTIGIIFYKMEKGRYMHFIWHLFVLGGSIAHYFFILLYCI